jgi:hypothetical protein
MTGGPKSRRRKEQGFLGASTFLEKDGKLKAVSKKRVGIMGMTAPARGHTEIYAEDGTTKIGEVTSGGFAPTLNKPISMGCDHLSFFFPVCLKMTYCFFVFCLLCNTCNFSFVATEHTAENTPVLLKVRDKMLPAHVSSRLVVGLFSLLFP